MARIAETTPTSKNGHGAKPAVSELGRKLRRISERIAASGEKLLTRRELERELAERRGGFADPRIVRTFLDSGVLLAAARSLVRDRERALEILEDPNRRFLTSPYVHLELVPKAIFHKKALEKSFYDEYFNAAEWCRDLDKIEATAQIEAAKSGLAAMDALHLAAAKLSGADEFVTTERPGKPIYRTPLVKIVHLFD